MRNDNRKKYTPCVIVTLVAVFLFAIYIPLNNSYAADMHIEDIITSNKGNETNIINELDIQSNNETVEIGEMDVPTGNVKINGEEGIVDVQFIDESLYLLKFQFDLNNNDLTLYDLINNLLIENYGTPIDIIETDDATSTSTEFTWKIDNADIILNLYSEDDLDSVLTLRFLFNLL